MPTYAYRKALKTCVGKSGILSIVVVVATAASVIAFILFKAVAPVNVSEPKAPKVPILQHLKLSFLVLYGQQYKWRRK